MTKQAALDLLRLAFPELKQTYGVRRLGVFGSVARDEASPQSDVDVVVDLERHDLFLEVHLRERLESVLGLPVHVLAYRQSLMPRLKSRIDLEAVYV